MLRALIVAGVAAAAGHQLYRRGAFQRLGTDLKERAAELRRRADDRLGRDRAAHEAPGGPGGGPVQPVAIHTRTRTPNPVA